MYSKEELKELNLKFWNDFKEFGQSISESPGRKKKWLFNQTGISGVALRFEMERSSARVALELQHKSEERRINTFEILERYKLILEEGFENGLIWEFYHKREDNGQEVCRIYTQLNDFDFHCQEQWPEVFTFFTNNMTRLEENYLMVKEVLQEELKF